MWLTNYNDGILTGLTKKYKRHTIHIRLNRIMIDEIDYKLVHGWIVNEERRRYTIKVDSKFIERFHVFVCGDETQHKLIKKDLTKLLKYFKVLNIT